MEQYNGHQLSSLKFPGELSRTRLPACSQVSRTTKPNQMERNATQQKIGTEWSQIFFQHFEASKNFLNLNDPAGLGKRKKRRWSVVIGFLTSGNNFEIGSKALDRDDLLRMEDCQDHPQPHRCLGGQETWLRLRIAQRKWAGSLIPEASDMEAGNSGIWHGVFFNFFYMFFKQDQHRFIFPSPGGPLVANTLWSAFNSARRLEIFQWILAAWPDPLPTPFFLNIVPTFR